MNCYGNFKEGNPKCAACEHLTWCKDAGDPPLSGGAGYDKVSNIESIVAPAKAESADNFGSGHWMALIRRILELDDKRIRTIIRLKIENPDISLAEIGRKFGITKQAIDKEIDFACSYMPELAIILRNRPGYNKWRTLRTHSPGNPSRVCRAIPVPVQLELPFEVDGSPKNE